MTKSISMVVAALLPGSAALAEHFQLAPDLTPSTQLIAGDVTPQGVGVLACSGLRWMELHLDAAVLVSRKPDNGKHAIWLDEVSAGPIRIDWAAPATKIEDYLSDRELSLGIGYQF